MQVYTAIVGGKDPERDDILCFGDAGRFKRPVMEAKIYKILSHQFLNTDISIWVDGNIFLLVDPKKIVEEFLGDADIAVWKHFDRDDVYDEARAAMGLGGDQVPYIKKHLEHFEEIKFPRHTGLAECNVIIRRHNKRVEKFNNYWWSEICRHSNRDQLSFPVVVKKCPDVKINYVEGNVRNHNYFKYVPH